MEDRSTRFRRVLVVDDDPAMRRLIARILGSSGYDVTEAGDGAEAMDVVRQESPNFVVTDWDMPVLDGAAFCRLVRCQDVPHYVYIVMLTGTQTSRLVEGLAAGADDFVTKPIKGPELLARMQAGARVLGLEEKLRFLASHDPLTGLLNRRAFFEAFQAEWARARRIGYPFSCAMIDVDHFKHINDRHGHLAGDAVLKAVSRLLTRRGRETSRVGRYGGEEFSVLLPDTDEQGALAWAESYRSAVANARLVADQRRVRITVSVGVAQWHEETASPSLSKGKERPEVGVQRLLDLADQALLAAKQQGRNRVVAFGSLMPAK
jgi:two-component system cell cycle response regulator